MGPAEREGVLKAHDASAFTDPLHARLRAKLQVRLDAPTKGLTCHEGVRRNAYTLPYRSLPAGD